MRILLAAQLPVRSEVIGLQMVEMITISVKDSLDKRIRANIC